MLIDWMKSYSESYSDFITFITLCILLLNFKKFRYNKSILFLIGFSMVFFTSFIALIQHETYDIYNILTYYVGFDLVYKILLILFHYFLLRNKKIVLIILFLYCAYNLIFLFYQYPVGNEDSFSALNINIYENYNVSYFINLLLFFVLWITFFYETFNSNAIFQIRYYFPLWVTVSCMLYDVGMLPIFLTADDAYKLDLMAPIIAVTSTLSYAILIYGIIVNKPLKSNPLNEIRRKY